MHEGAGSEGGGARKSRVMLPGLGLINTQSQSGAAWVALNAGDEVVLGSQGGLLTRCSSDTIRVCSRSARGVSVMRVAADDGVWAVAILPGGSGHAVAAEEGAPAPRSSKPPGAPPAAARKRSSSSSKA